MLDNTLAESWDASIVFGGTPGYENSVVTGFSEELENKKLFSFKLFQNYPNPFNAVTKIEYSVVKSENTKIVVYDIQGRQVDILLDRFHSQGQYTLSWNAENLSSGFYFVYLSGKNNKRIIKSILIK